MGIFFNEFTGTHDVAVTAGNSGSGGAQAFTAVEAGVFYSTTRAVVGSSCARFEATGAVTAGARFALANPRDIAIRFYIYMTNDDVDILRVSHATDTTAFTLRMTAADSLRLVTKGAVTAWTGAQPFPLGEWVRVEMFVQQGTTSSSSSVQLAYYAGNSLTPIESVSLSSLNLGGDLGALTQVRIGRTSATDHSAIFVDSLAWNTDADATGLIGPPVNSAPIVNAGTDQNVAAGASVGLTATASDSDGSIASYAWSFLYPASGAPTLTGATTATPSFTAGVAGSLYVLQCQVTDNGGASSTDTVEVRVPSSSNFAPLPMDGIAVGAWTRAGAATTDGAALADSDDTTYTESPDFTGVSQTEEYRLAPIVARDTLQFVVRTSVTATGGTRTVSLIDGSTVRQTWTLTSTTTAGNQTLNVTAPGNIVDWGNLRLRFSVVS